MSELSNHPWIVRPRPSPAARVRLFCFPFAGGGASSYRTWPAHLPADVEVLAIQLPGREERLPETPFRDVSDLVPVLVEVLTPWLDRSFALFGHSMGALVAFELARALRARGKPLPAHLFLSAHCGPRKPHCLPPVEAMPDDELSRVLRRLGGSSDASLADDEVMQIVLPLIRADLTLCERYRYVPDEPLSCPISAFGGTLDDFVRRADLAGWRAETRAGFDLRMFPGGHFFLDRAKPRLLQAVADELSRIGRPPAVARHEPQERSGS